MRKSLQEIALVDIRRIAFLFFNVDPSNPFRFFVGFAYARSARNPTREVHPFHIHQVHFLSYAENGVRTDPPEWLDTINVPYGGTVVLIMDFTDPIIKGMSLFHCHLLSHEDKGMMAKILFQ